MEISVIASGSNGNCCLLEEKNTSFLIDAGKSGKEIEARAKRLGKSLENIKGVLVTHCHTDHCSGADIIARRYNVPLYITKAVHNELGFVKADVKYFLMNSSFRINDLAVKPIATSHDVSSCGFVINKFGIFTDTGKVTKQMADAMKGLKGVLLESNYDVDMLINGPYPPFLKQRIFSEKGHLSNADASTFIKEKGKELDLVLLGHLSANNNTPKLAKSTFEALTKREGCVLSRDSESGTWEI